MHFLNPLVVSKNFFFLSKIKLYGVYFTNLLIAPAVSGGGRRVKAGVEGVGVVSEVLHWLRTRPGHHYHQH